MFVFFPMAGSLFEPGRRDILFVNAMLRMPDRGDWPLTTGR
jgi:hypothetical protein